MSDSTPSWSVLRRRARRWAGNLSRGAVNALEWVREGRLGVPYEAPNEVVFSSGILALRRYTTERERAKQPGSGPILLVPPLMVTHDVYDISPELSAVAHLARAGLDVYVADFGIPEEVEGGLERTIHDHVKAVDVAVGYLRETTGRGTHIAGYSQGGMFAYLAAAYRRSRDVSSVITFGSPVDMRRNMPVAMPEELAARVLDVTHDALGGVFARIEGLPADFTSFAFKLISPRQELKNVMRLVGLLHNREALVRQEPKRRFLGGEGFVAWPGPAFRTLVTEFIAQNRLASGGVVLGGRTVSLSDITCPILYFVGRKDQMARPASVRAIERVASSEEVYAHWLSAGHFGLVVGSKAMAETWPLVVDWVRWREGVGERPSSLEATSRSDETRRAAARAPFVDSGGARDGSETEAKDSAHDKDAHPTQAFARISERVAELGRSSTLRMGELSRRVAGVVGALRWQMPRLGQLARLREDSRISLSGLLAERAAEIPDAPFFLWNGRALSYGEANDRVTRVCRAFHAAGVRPGQHVALAMDNHPRLLTAACALNRMGAVAILVPPHRDAFTLNDALRAGRATCLITDARRACEDATALNHGPHLVLGRATDALPAGVKHLDEQALTDAPELPSDLTLDAGLARDLAMILFTRGTTAAPKAARITNRRCALGALGTAAACRLTPSDTVYCALPLQHASGMLVACGGALAGGSRLALSEGFSVTRFWDEVRRVGATVVVHVGEMCEVLCAAPPQPAERRHAVRVFVGYGLRPKVWSEVLARFGKVRVIELYGSTEGNVLLVNLRGHKLGSVGRGFGDDDGDLALVERAADGQPHRDETGRCVPVPRGTGGLLLARIDPTHPLGYFDGYVDDAQTRAHTLHDAFEAGDAWFNTGDVLRRDDDGDFWFVERT